MKKILISGSTGFVGNNLVKYLQSKKSAFITLDRELSLPSDIAGASIVHLAGKAHDVTNVSDPKVYYDVNYELTKMLFDSFLKSDASRFIFVSSVKAVADTVLDNLTENTLPSPQTHYGKSKLMAEQYIQEQVLPEGKSCYILRPCMIHGPGNKGNLTLLYKFVSKGFPYPLASFKNKRSFLSIENLCFVIHELHNREDIPGGVYQVADDEPLSTSEVVQLLADALGKPSKEWHTPASLIKIAARFGDMLRLPLTTERLRKLTESYVVSNAKLKGALKKELPLSARNGIIKTAQSFVNA